MELTDLLGKLKNVQPGSNGQYSARCPAHDDQNNSLSISGSDGGKILINCHRGCRKEDIMSALGLGMSDLFRDQRKSGKTGRGEFDRAYDYTDINGTIVHQVVRWKNPKGFSQRRPDPANPGKWLKDMSGVMTVIYRLPDVAKAIKDGKPIIVTEGEKDADNLTTLGFTATTNPMGAGKWRDHHSDYLVGADVIIIPDNDEAGKEHAADVAKSLQGKAASVRIINLTDELPDLPAKGDATDFFHALGKPEGMIRFRRLINNAKANTPNDSDASANLPELKPVWPELIPFEQCGALPPFPLEVFPPATREFVYAASETVQAPIDMVGSCALGTLQIACRGRYPVRLPNGHIERPCFYIAPIAPPSERKSGVIDVDTRPLVEYEAEYNRAHGGEVNQSKSELKILQGKIAAAEQQAVKEKDAGKQQSVWSEVQALNTELAEFESVEPLRLFGADVTPEKLASMIKFQGGVFALVSAEGGGLFENIGRYSDKGGLELYLNGYSGDRVCVDRKTSESIVIDHPTLNLIAPCQPSVIVDLFSDRQKSGRGLLSRILFIKCPSRVGSRKATSKPLDGHIAANYKNLCYGMLASKSTGNLAYDSGVFDVYNSFFDEIETQLTPDVGELSSMADWAGKLHGQMTRLAGLIHCIAAFEQGKNPLDTQINADEARAAATLARYYLAHARAVYTEQAEPEAISNARYLWGKINSINSLQISKSILTRKTQGKRDFNLDESLFVLIERGYIRVEFAQTGGAGRPSETIVVNPDTEGIVKKLNLLNLTPGTDDNFNLFNLFTMPANVPDVETAAMFTEVPDDEIGDCPFLD